MDKGIKKESVESEGKDKDTQTNNKQGMSNTTQLIVVFIIGLLIGTFGSPAVLSDRYEKGDDDTAMVEQDSDKPGEEGNGQDTPTTPTLNTVLVSDQLAGDRVLLEEVELAVSGWVVVHEDLNGSLGNALGAARFDAGTHERGYVKLLRNTEVNQNYYIVLYEDNGDGAFSLTDDTLLANTDNGPISETFKTIMIDRKTN